ncbi:MAG TPA: VOC family protein [Actinomycetota bacterium]|nr:VOC family protein [Actinomycetota bacterium]
MGARLHAVILRSRDLERAKRFYGGSLGLELRYEEPGHVAGFDAGGGVMLLLHAAEDDERPPRERGAQVALPVFAVADVDAAVEGLRGAGWVVAEEPTDRPWGEREACVLDPDGHRIRLVQPLGRGGPLTEPEAREIEDRLRSLGYID